MSSLLWWKPVSRIGFVLKGYPRLSETFIAQEIRGLELRGFDLAIYSLRPPRETARHSLTEEIVAPVNYLPERLREAPARLLTACASQWRSVAFWRTLSRALRRTIVQRSLEPVQRWGQGVILSCESAGVCDRLHAHFLHSPADVCETASTIRGTAWTCSAHAKDIWTLEPAEVRRKLSVLDGIVTCTKAGADYLRTHASRPDKVRLVHHGLDLERFASVAEKAPDDATIEFLSVGRAVEKKGFDCLLDALRLIPADRKWRWTLVGDGTQLRALEEMADALGLADRCTFAGAQPQNTVLDSYRRSHVFVLPSRVLPSGDRDGLPNVIMEAMSQRLPVVSSALPGIEEAVVNGETGVLTPSDDARALADALIALIDDADLRRAMGQAGEDRIRALFSHGKGLDALVAFFREHGVEPARQPPVAERMSECA